MKSDLLHHRANTHRFAILLGSFLLLLLATPLFEDTLAAAYVGDALYYLFLVGAVYAVRISIFFKLALFLYAVAMLCEVASYFTNQPYILVLTTVISSTYLALVALLIAVNVAKQREIKADTVMGGLCVYVIMGVFWSLLFITLELLRPGSFNFGVHGQHPDLMVSGGLLFYYSFTTLLTIGYGDVIAMSSMAQTLSILEGLIGRFYIVFFIASLIGQYIYRRLRRQITQ